jgi:hypothetical protein
MIYYLVSRLNPDLSTFELMNSASRYLFLATQANYNPNIPYYNVFNVFTKDNDSIMIINSQEKILINNKNYISDFLNMFSISEIEKTNKLSAINNGDIILFSSITPSNIVSSTYQDLIDMGILEEDLVD